jgi:hypothetical protein
MSVNIKFFGLILILLFTLQMSGCITMANGRTQDVRIISKPPGAKILVSPMNLTALTPITLKLQRKHLHIVNISKEGYIPQSIPLGTKTDKSVWRNLVWVHPLGWIVGGIVDLSTGAWRGFEIDQIDIELEPVPVKLEPLEPKPEQVEWELEQIDLEIKPVKLEHKKIQE